MFSACVAGNPFRRWVYLFAFRTMYSIARLARLMCTVFNVLVARSRSKDIVLIAGLTDLSELGYCYIYPPSPEARRTERVERITIVNAH